MDFFRFNSIVIHWLLPCHRHEFKLARESAEKWTHRATTHENNLKKKSEEITSLQQEISVLKNQMTTNAEQYQSTLGIKEAQNNQLQESNNLLQQVYTESVNKLALKTNEFNTLEEKVKDTSRVLESLVERLKDKQQEINELKRKLILKKFNYVQSVHHHLHLPLQ